MRREHDWLHWRSVRGRGTIPLFLAPPETLGNKFIIETRSTCWAQSEEVDEFAAQPHVGDATANSSNSSDWAQQVDRASIIEELANVSYKFMGGGGLRVGVPAPYRGTDLTCSH